jgi:hypothetical protein
MSRWSLTRPVRQRRDNLPGISVAEPVEEA